MTKYKKGDRILFKVLVDRDSFIKGCGTITRKSNKGILKYYIRDVNLVTSEYPLDVFRYIYSSEILRLV